MGKNTKKSAYAKAGVDIDQAEKAVDLMKKHVRSTYNQYVLSKIGAFGGLLDASMIKHLNNPVLVQSIDGVGTKMMVAEMMNKYTIGQDIVNHCINDILVLGAQPITFLNYVGAARLKPKTMEEIVKNMAIACEEVGIPIISGETAEMPGVYCEGRHDVVGCITGIVGRCKIIDGSKIADGDILIGLPSNGLHTNGYSLARKAFFKTGGFKVNTTVSQLGYITAGAELLKVHKCYFEEVFPLLGISTIEIHGIAHITGGGLPPVFKLIQKIEKVSDIEMCRVFNLGIGMVLIAPAQYVSRIKGILSEKNMPGITIGKIKKTRSKKEKRVFFSH